MVSLTNNSLSLRNGVSLQIRELPELTFTKATSVFESLSYYYSTYKSRERVKVISIFGIYNRVPTRLVLDFNIPDGYNGYLMTEAGFKHQWVGKTEDLPYEAAATIAESNDVIIPVISFIDSSERTSDTKLMLAIGQTTHEHGPYCSGNKLLLTHPVIYEDLKDKSLLEAIFSKYEIYDGYTIEEEDGTFGKVSVNISKVYPIEYHRIKGAKEYVQLQVNYTHGVRKRCKPFVSEITGCVVTSKVEGEMSNYFTVQLGTPTSEPTEAEKLNFITFLRSLLLALDDAEQYSEMDKFERVKVVQTALKRGDIKNIKELAETLGI